MRVAEHPSLRQIASFYSKHRWLRWLQAILLLTATLLVGVPSFLLSMEFLTYIIEQSSSGGETLQTKLLHGNLGWLVAAVLVIVGILVGLAASWVVVFMGADRVGTKPLLSRKVPIGLALGIVSGSSALLWSFSLRYPYPYMLRALLMPDFWVWFPILPIALATTQLYLLQHSSSRLQKETQTDFS